MNIRPLPKDMPKRIRKRRASLNRRKRMLPNIVRLRKPEYAFDLIISYMLLHFQNIRIEILNVVTITEDESLFGVKAERYDIFYVVFAHLNCLLEFQLISIDIFFIICYLYY